MASRRRVLIHGADDPLAGRLAAACSAFHVVGTGRDRAPAHWPDSAGWVPLRAAADPADALAQASPEILVLFPDRTSRGPLSGAGRSGDVAGQVAAAAASHGLERLILWSATWAVDPVEAGQGPLPAAAPPARQPAPPGRVAAAMESAVQDRLARLSAPELVILRAAPVVGDAAPPEIDGLVDMPLLPRVAGADPPLQFLHDEDAVSVLARAVEEAPAGTYEVAADGVLPWSELCRILGRPGVRLPATLWRAALGVGRLTRLSRTPASVVDLASRCWVADNARLKTHLGYRPRLSSRRALAAWAGRRPRRDDQK